MLPFSCPLASRSHYDPKMFAPAAAPEKATEPA
jgi:hypothetical protein